jgi:hypothetical protein
LAIFGKALETAAKNVDFPMLGNPTNPISASILSYKKIIFYYPKPPNLSSLVIETLS